MAEKYNLLLLIYPAVLFAITFAGSKIYKHREFNPVFFDYSQTKFMQASACLGIIIHHLTQRYTSYASPDIHNPITIFNSLGILFTSVFFFVSGYGLVYSIVNKPDYLASFFEKRILRIVIPFYTINIFLVLLLLYTTKYPPSSDIILSFMTGIVLYNGNCWFMIEIFYFYIIFFVVFKLIKKKDVALFLLCLSSLVLIITGYYSGHDSSELGNHWLKGEWWYNTTIMFSFGGLFARFYRPVTEFIKKNYIVVLAVSLVLFCASFIFEERMLSEYGYYEIKTFNGLISGQLITYIAQTILCILYIWLLILINLKIKYGNKLLSFIGIISLELYMIHDLFVSSVMDNYKLNILLRYGIVIAASILLATVFHYFNMAIFKVISIIKAGKKYHTDNEDIFRKKEKAKKEKRRKTIVVTVILIVIIIVLAGVYFRMIRPVMECNQEKKVIALSKPGDEILFGRYDTDVNKSGAERLTWIVLKKEDNKAMLITKNGLTGGAYSKNRDGISWDDSDLKEYLNNQMYNGMFSSYEQKLLILNPGDNAYVSLLTPLEAATLFKDDASREMVLTEAAIKEGITNYNTLSKVKNRDMKGYRTSWWWLRGEEYSVKAPYVSLEGEIIENDADIYNYVGAIRPVVWVAF